MWRFYKVLILLFSFILFFCISSFAQKQVLLKGTIKDNQNRPIPFATVFLTPGNFGQMTDSLGAFSIQLPAKGKFHIRITALGYNKLEEDLLLTQSIVKHNWQLKEEATHLQEVHVTASAHGAMMKLKPIKAQVINTTASQQQPSTLIELMNRSAGIRIRQSGALGAPSDVMLNGFQNRSIRYFKDGLPLNYLGAGFNISLVPVNMLDHVEVYKGVLPTYLGADALGGAINLVTKDSYKSFAEASYEVGSFNTHRVSLNAGYTSPDKKFFMGINGFFNYSDGDYQVDVKTPDPQTGVQEDVRVKLFHNRFRNYYTEIYAGIRDVKWADELRFSLTGFSINKQFQFGSTMFKPFGAAWGVQHSVVPALLYKKSFWNNKLQFTEFAEINTLNAGITDTLHGHYDWLGHFTANPAEKGEISNRGSLSDIDYHFFTSRSNLRYQLTTSQTLDLNVVVNRYMREGNDPYGYTFPDGKQVLSEPATYNKTVAALGWTADLPDKRLQNNFIVKFFHYRTLASDVTVTGEKETVGNSNNQWGIADGLKYKVSEKATLQFSVETALRLPEQDELFGDGNLKLANFNLKPERSLNINLSYKNAEPGKYHFETNVFYRYTKDMILMMPLYFLNSQSQNVDKVQGEGLDVDADYQITSWLKASGNFTYQNLRLVRTGNQTTEGARLRNTPYFFANLGLNGRLQHVLNKKDRLNIYWYYGFVRQYYLDYIPKSVEPDGFLGLWGKAGINAQNIIPDQNIHTAGFTYYPFEKPLSIGFQLKNIFNSRVYDHFKIQNPGRNFSVKISYSL